ncbi:MAG TPA: hypothetical protein VGC74_14625 [Stenotrophomonas sp.]|jgi:hypothetical protein
MRVGKRGAMVVVACQLSGACVLGAWVSTQLVERLTLWHLSSAADGWDNVFLVLILPLAMLVVERPPLTPALSRLQVQASRWLCGFLMLIGVLFGAPGIGAVLGVGVLLDLAHALRVHDGD